MTRCLSREAVSKSPVKIFGKTTSLITTGALLQEILTACRQRTHDDEKPLAIWYEIESMAFECNNRCPIKLFVRKLDTLDLNLVLVLETKDEEGRANGTGGRGTFAYRPVARSPLG